MLVSNITHAARPIEHCLVIHLHARGPARHHKLLLVARGMVVATSVTKPGQCLNQGGSLLFGVRVKKYSSLSWLSSVTPYFLSWATVCGVIVSCRERFSAYAASD